MVLSTLAEKIYKDISLDGTKLGDLRTIAKGINKNHALAKELWSTGKFHPRLLAILIIDKKELSTEAVDSFFNDMQGHRLDERTQLADWLMANQLAKDKKTIAMMESWKNNPSVLKRRIYWYYQGRLRWTGQAPPNNTEELLATIEEKILNEAPEVQWAMNFTAGWIGIFDKAYRHRCINMGEKLGLYKDEVVGKHCTPNYLPEFINLVVEKRNL